MIFVSIISTLHVSARIDHLQVLIELYLFMLIELIEPYIFRHFTIIYRYFNRLCSYLSPFQHVNLN
jgi:hypothetical protein